MAALVVATTISSIAITAFAVSGIAEARRNQLARHLRGLGVGAESLVGVLVDRSPAMVIASVGVLKASGT